MLLCYVKVCHALSQDDVPHVKKSGHTFDWYFIAWTKVWHKQYMSTYRGKELFNHTESTFLFTNMNDVQDSEEHTFLHPDLYQPNCASVWPDS